jgi:hypothetical protein
MEERMPEVKDLFRLATENVRPDLGTLQRQHRKQRWHQARRTAVGIAVAAGLVASGVALGISALRERAEGPATRPVPELTAPINLQPTIDRLTGIWVRIEGRSVPLMVSFAADGTFSLDQGPQIVTSPAGRGAYEISGNTITFTNLGGDVCVDGDAWAWRAALADDGRLHVEHVEPAVPDQVQPIPGTQPGCAIPYGTEWNLVRVYPRSLAGTLIVAEVNADDGGPPTSSTVLAGIWLLEGGHQLVRFGADGTYSIIAGGRLDAPEDVGTFDLDGQGTITFTSGAESRTCAEGTVTVWQGVQLNLDALGGDIGGNACGDLPAGNAAFVRLLSDRA